MYAPQIAIRRQKVPPCGEIIDKHPARAIIHNGTHLTQGSKLDSILNLYRTGRLPRLQFFLISLVVGFVTIIPAMFMSGGVEELGEAATDRSSSTFLFYAAYSLAVGVLLSWHVTVRRLHDIGVSGWWLVPYTILSSLPLIGAPINLLSGLILLFWPGTKGSNQYGPPPSPERGIWSAFLNR